MGLEQRATFRGGSQQVLRDGLTTFEYLLKKKYKEELQLYNGISFIVMNSKNSQSLGPGCVHTLNSPQLLMFMLCSRMVLLPSAQCNCWLLSPASPLCCHSCSQRISQPQSNTTSSK